MESNKLTQILDHFIDRAQIASFLTDNFHSNYSYPWSKLEHDLKHQGISHLQLVGYGSLINENSSRKTIKNTPIGGHEPILAFGATRIFNYTMSYEAIRKYQIDDPGNFRANLNLDWTGAPESVFNGRLIPVALSDIENLRQREKGYHLRPVAFVPWNKFNSHPSLAFALCANNEVVNGKTWVNDTLLPYPAYLDLCLHGAKSVDSDFLNCFLKTTWLGDRITRLDKYIDSL